MPSPVASGGHSGELGHTPSSVYREPEPLHADRAMSTGESRLTFDNESGSPGKLGPDGTAPAPGNRLFAELRGPEVARTGAGPPL
jgi:hypothetical protein